MKLEEFLTSNKISLSEKVLEACNQAIAIMSDSKDLLHNENHIFRLLEDLNKFLKEEKTLDKSQINFDVLLIALCWHDTWRSTHFSETVITMLFDQFWDGFGSIAVFKSYLKTHAIDKDTAKQTIYAIRKHAEFQFTSYKTIESKVLKDLDNLDVWYIGRLEPLKQKYLYVDKPNKRLLKLAKFYFDNFMKKATDKKFFYDWSKKEFTKRKVVYFDEVDKLLSKYKHLLQ